MSLMVPVAVSGNDDLKKLLGKDTVCVVHVDLVNIDIDAVFNNGRKPLEPFLEAIDVESWNKYRDTVKSGKTLLTDGLGIKDVYLVIAFGGNTFPIPGYVAIPKTDTLNASAISSMLDSANDSMEINFVFSETDDFYCITITPINRHLITAEEFGRKRQETAQSFARRSMTDRPEFLEAHETVRDYPIQVLFAPPKYVKKIFSEIRPELPEPLEKIDLAAMINGLRWKAVGIDPAKPELLGIVEAETELDAQVMDALGHQFLSRASAELLKYLQRCSEDAEYTQKIVRNQGPELLESLLKAYPSVINEENLKLLENGLIPKPKGKRFTVKWSEETINTVFAKLGPIIVDVIAKNIAVTRYDAQQKQLTHNFKMLGLGMHNYHDTKKCFPPAFTVDENGKPLHSWRVLILPYVEQSALYESIRLDEPWDSEYNRQFHDKMPDVYYNPMYPDSDKNRNTNFCIVVGPDTFGKAGDKGPKLHDLKDGTSSNTVMVIERKTPVCWMAPIDISQENAYLGINKNPEGIGGLCRDGINTLLGDGAAMFIPETVDLETLQNLLDMNAGKSINFP